MVQERIDIVINERGSRTVKRSIDSIADSAWAATRAMRLFQNSLFVLGGAGLLNGLRKAVDTLTNFENRIRLVTNSAAEMEAVQQRLFDTAQRTRTSFESTAEIYTRMALSVKGLGLSQEEVIRLTESLNKATILSGANAREANAALVQLGQGMASNRLSGDELRSVLEQLPYVADVISKHFGVTRGQLRQLGKEGKISAKDIVEAFKDAQNEIDIAFSNTVPTIEQSFSYFYTGFLRILDSIDDFTHASEILARSIIAVADALPILATALISLSAGFVTTKIFQYTAALANFIKLNREMAAAITAGNATLLTSTGIEAAKAASSLKAAAATQANAAAEVGALAVRRQVLIKNLEIIKAEQTMNSFIVKNGRARNVLTGSFVSLSAATARQNALARELLFTERSLRLTTSELAAANTTAAASANALAAAQSRNAAAAAANGGFVARLQARLPLLAGAIGSVAGAFGALSAVIVANPYAAIAVAVIALGTGFYYLSGYVTVTADKVVTLQDVLRALFSYLTDALNWVGGALLSAFGPALNWIGQKWSDLTDIVYDVFYAIIGYVKSTINSVIQVMIAGVNTIIAAWQHFPGALYDIMVVAMNSAISVAIWGINQILEAFNSLFGGIDSLAQSVGMDAIFGKKFTQMKVDSDDWKLKTIGALQEVGDVAKKEFDKVRGKDYVGDATKDVMTRARIIANERLINLKDTKLKGDDGKGGGGGGGGSKKSFADIVKEMEQENMLLTLNTKEREKMAKVLEVEKELKRNLSDSEKETINNLVEQNQALKVQADIYDDIKKPQQDYIDQLAAVNALLEKGRISSEEYARKVIDIKLAYLNTKTDLVSGFERGFLKLTKEAGDFATQAEDIIVDAAHGMRDAFADFVVDGKADFDSLIKDIEKSLIKLALNQAFNAIFSNIAGGGGGANGDGIGGALIQGIRHLLGFATGGEFTVSGNKGGGIDSVPVSFMATPGEKVKITRPGQETQGAPVEQKVQVNVYNQAQGTTTSQVERKGSDGSKIVDVFVKQSKSAAASDISQGGTDLNRALEARYGLNPARGNQQ